MIAATAVRRALVRRPLTVAQRQALFAYLFLLPSLLYFLIFFVIPMVIEFLASLQGGQALLGHGAFVGLQNYTQALSDPLFWQVVGVTVSFSVLTVGGGVVIGLTLALILNDHLPFRTVFRSIIYFPYLTAFVIAALIFQAMLDPYQGIVNTVLQHFGLPPQDWLVNPSLALPLIAAITVLHGLGNNMVLFLAGLQGIPQEYYEAAAIDGATTWRRFRHITAPLLTPVTVFVIIVDLIDALESFLQPFVMTQGGPANATRLFAFHVYEVAFSNLQFGYASALSFLLFVVMLVVALLILRFGQRQVIY